MRRGTWVFTRARVSLVGSKACLLTAEKEFVLGGAQIGQSYGKPMPGPADDEGNSRSLLGDAWNGGFTSVDTARVYGRSESWIGQLEWRGKVYTKLDPTADPLTSLEASLRTLNRASVEGLLLCHDSRSLRRYSKNSWLRHIDSMKNRVGRFGLSLYQDQFDQPLQAIKELEIIQIPFNVLSEGPSQRHVESWQENGKLIYARSIFAQGLLLDGPASVKDQDFLRALKNLKGVCRELNLSAGELALRWALGKTFIHGLIVGASTGLEVQQIMSWAEHGPLGTTEVEVIDKLMAEFRRPFDMRVLK